jgi:hypothetical protein
VQLEGPGKLKKKLMTSLGLEPVTFQLVAYQLLAKHVVLYTEERQIC